MTCPDPAYVEAYERDGFVRPLNTIPEQLAAELLAELTELEEAELARRGDGWPKRDYRPWEMDGHPAAAWMERIVKMPEVLAHARALLGPNILLRNADIFVKEPGRRREIAWHWDTAERGPDADRIVTAWLALSPATRANGCLRYARGSHRMEIEDAPKDKFHLTFSPTAVASLDQADVVYNELEPGQLSLHHFRIAHASSGNTTTSRRVGVAMRIMTPDVSPNTAESGVATLLSGVDTHKRFALRERFPMSWTF